MVSERPTRAPAYLRARKLQAELGALSAAVGMGLACRGGGGGQRCCNGASDFRRVHISGRFAGI